MFNFQTGNIIELSQVSIVGILHELETVLPGAGQKTIGSKLDDLVFRINEYIRHSARRNPKVSLTIAYLRSIQQSITKAIAAHIVYRDRMISTALLAVFQGVNLFKMTSLIPKFMSGEIDSLKMLEEYEKSEGPLKYKKKRFTRFRKK